MTTTRATATTTVSRPGEEEQVLGERVGHASTFRRGSPPSRASSRPGTAAGRRPRLSAGHRCAGRAWRNIVIARFGYYAVPSPNEVQCGAGRGDRAAAVLRRRRVRRRRGAGGAAAGARAPQSTHAGHATYTNPPSSPLRARRAVPDADDAAALHAGPAGRRRHRRLPLLPRRPRPDAAARSSPAASSCRRTRTSSTTRSSSGSRRPTSPRRGSSTPRRPATAGPASAARGISGRGCGQSVFGGAAWITSWAPGGGERFAPQGHRRRPRARHAGRHADPLQPARHRRPGDGSDQSSLKLRVGPPDLAVQPLATTLLAAPIELPCPPGETGDLCDRATSTIDSIRRYGQPLGAHDRRPQPALQRRQGAGARPDAQLRPGGAGRHRGPRGGRAHAPARPSITIEAQPGDAGGARRAAGRPGVRLRRPGRPRPAGAVPRQARATTCG